MFPNRWKNQAVATLAGMAATLFAFTGAQTVRAQELDESLKIDGEVATYFESTSTNFAGDYNPDVRGQGAWSGFFTDGLPDTYSFNEVRFKEAEVHFNKATRINENWVMTNRVELEFKTVNTSNDSNKTTGPYNDIDFEEGSAKFQHDSGLYVDMGILQDTKVYTPALLLDMAAGDDKGFDENPGLRLGYRKGDINVSLRYTSQFVTKSSGLTDAEGEALKDKTINQTMLHGEAIYKSDMVMAELLYTTISSANKENSNFQSGKGKLASADDQKAFEAAGLDDTDVLEVSVAVPLGNFVPYVNLENWKVKLNDNASDYSVQILTVGLNAKNLGPGDLILATEQGTSTDFYTDPVKGEATDVKYTGYGVEYLFHMGKSVHGPGFKTFSNDAPNEELKGTVYYYGSKFVF